MPTNPDEAIRIESEIETLLIGYCRRHDGYRWMRNGNVFTITSRYRSRFSFSLESYINDKEFTLDSINKFFCSPHNPVVTDLEESKTILNNQASVDHIQWINHQLPHPINDTYKVHNAGGTGLTLNMVKTQKTSKYI